MRLQARPARLTLRGVVCGGVRGVSYRAVAASSSSSLCLSMSRLPMRYPPELVARDSCMSAPPTCPSCLLCPAAGARVLRAGWLRRRASCLLPRHRLSALFTVPRCSLARCLCAPLAVRCTLEWKGREKERERGFLLLISGITKIGRKYTRGEKLSEGGGGERG